jgi:hypothetical protein
MGKYSKSLKDIIMITKFMVQEMLNNIWEQSELLCQTCVICWIVD